MDFAPGLLELIANARVHELYEERYGSRADSPWQGWAILTDLAGFAARRRPGAHGPTASTAGRAHA